MEPKPPKADEQNTDTDDNTAPAPEHGGRGGLDPVRYGDWEIGGKCVDF